MSDTNLRDTFAAAALTGLLANHPVYGSDHAPKRAYELADAMLRERVVAQNATTSLDPASTPQVPSMTDQERFNAAVMNWISEATSAIQIEENYRPILADACLACWNAYGKDSTNHDAAPAAKAVSDEDRTDKAATSHRRDRPGDTPSEAEIDALEFVVVNGHAASVMDYGILRQWLVRLRPEFERTMPCESDKPKPINDVYSDRSKPIERTPDSHTAPTVCASQSECTEPVAWLVEGCEYDTGCEYQYASLLKEGAEAAVRDNGGRLVPLYRSPPAAWQLVHDNERLRDEVMMLRRPATWQEETVAIESAFERSGVARTWPGDEPDQMVPMVNAMADEIGRLRLTDAEREAISEAVLAFGEFAGDDVYVRTLRGLLERMR